MHPLLAILLLMLSGCLSTVAEVRQSEPTRTDHRPVEAKLLAWCTHQGLEALDQPYGFGFIEHPIDRAFIITATRTQDAISQRHVAGMELRFIPLPDGTRVELREGVIDGWWLSRDTWPIIDDCSRRLATAPPPPAAAAR